ncbi:MAG: hypothetical protein KDD50_06015, partial [Bdellovibrionales bacterium]|nr:hypothetical protein [Bdellovibrionales bacterium]
IYGSTINEVGTSSDCQYLTSYFHSDVAPANLTLNQNFDGSIGVNWLPDLSASPTPTYTVERSLYATGPFSVVLSNINGTSYKDVLINENASYYYRIFASNNTGRSLNSSVQGITVSMSAPVSSSTLTAYPGNAEVTLVWGGSTTNMVYRVYRSNQPGGPFALISTDLSTSTYIDESVVNDNLYYYIVKGSNPSGDSSQSNMVSAYVRATPSAPSNLFLAAHQTHPDCAGSPGITLTWKPNLYFKEFNILRGENGGIRNSIDSTAQTNKTYCNWTTDYDFSISVSATWGSNETAESLPVFYRWTNPPVVLLSPGDSEIKLTWTKPNGGNLFIYNDPWYDIYRSTSREGPFSLIHSGTTTLNYVDSSVVSGTPYFYYIQAYVQDTQSNTYIVGPPSAIKSATTNTNPSAPTNLVMVSNPQSQEAGLFWSSPSHYNNFYVYRSVDGGSYSYLTDTAATSLSTVASVQGLNRYYISAGWGDEQTTGSNIVIYRKANISGFTLVSSGSDLQLDWDDVAGVQDYQVYRSMNSFSGFSLLSTELSSQYTDSTALPGVGYYYKVIARFSDSTQGQWAGPLPGVLSGTNTPEGLSAQIENTGSIQLTWVPVQGAANHKVYQSLSATGPWNLKATILGSSLNNATLSALTNGVHYFKVDAKVGTQTYSS